MMSALLARLVLTVFILHSTVDATNTCDIKPRLIELNTTAANASLRLQLAASQGNAPQDFHLGFSISENNTIVAAARACSDFYTTYGFATPEACNSAMGGVLAVDAGGDNARKDVAVKVPTLGVTMEDYTITLLSEENKDYNRTAIGLGLNSTFIQQLLDDKVISSRSYGLSYNTTSYAGGPDSIVLGGIDKSRIQGPLFNSSIVSQKALLQVEIVGITITMPDLKGGTSVKDLLSGSALKNITAVLDNTIDQILFPVWLVEIYREMVNAEWYTGSTLDGFNTPGIYPSRFLDQNGSSNNNMTIKLSNGFETTIPASLLTQRVSDTADSPQNRTISNILETLSGSDIAILGALFLSQTYLSVDYDSMSFSLAGRAAEESAADLQQFPCADISDPTASKTTVDIINNDNTAATSGFNSDSNGVKVSRSSPNKFLGPILGSLLGTAAVLALILVLLRRRRNRLKAEAIAVRPRSMGEKETLGYKLTSTTSRASWVETEGLRMDMDEKRALAMRAPVSLMSSRVSLGARGSFGPSRSGTPIRNSYFTEDLDGTGTRPRQPSY